MKNKITIKDVVITILAVWACVGIYRIVGRQITNLFSNDYIANFVAQIFFSILAILCVHLLKRNDIYHADMKLLKKGWSSAGFEIFLILFITLLGLGSILNASIKGWEILLVIGQCLLVGFSEEALFRGLVQGVFHKYFKEDSLKHVLLAVFFGGLIFGATHLTNGLRPEVGLYAAFIQACVTAFNGMYFGAIYYRTGKNLWYLMILHGIYDLVAMISAGRFEGTTLENILAQSGNSGLQGILVWGTLYMIATLVVLRPKKVNPLLVKEEDTIL